MYYSLYPHIYFTHPTYLLCAPPTCDNSHPLCLCFSFFGLVFMYYSLDPHIYFTHPTCLLRAPPTCDSLAPLCLCLSFLGLCLCITRCTFTFTSHTPYLFVSIFCLCFMFTSCTSHITHAPYYCCFFSLLSFFVINFFLKKE